MAKKNRSKTTHTCKQAVSLITDYVAGTLEPDMTLDLEHHLSACPDCVAILKTYKKTIQVTQSLLLSGLLPEMETSKLQALHKCIGNHSDGR